MNTHTLVLGALFLLAVSGNTHAASFDCGKAASEVEKLICSDDELSKLDEALNKAYLQALKQTDRKEQTIKNQQQWLKEARNGCQTAECLKKAYEARIKDLEFLSSHATSGEVERPRLMSERLYADEYYTEPPSDALLWSKALLDLKVPGFSSRVDSSTDWRHCNYKTALATLHEIQSELGKESHYLRIWAANQDRVLLTCEGPSGSEEPPIRPSGESLPRRAQGDFLYQLGSWDFYRRDYQAALANYEQVAKLIDTPQRPNAAYMVVRTLAYLNRAEDAYHEVGKILSDPSLRSIHDSAKNYRFVIMSNSRSFDLDLSPELAMEHLKWLEELVQFNSKKTQQLGGSLALQKDALEQLNAYFPFYAPDTKAVDWWLTADDPKGPKMRAVKILARKIPLIDWMQAKWAYNVFDSDWLWALHAKDDPYWAQNRNIVIHAMNKWKTKRDGVWLQIAIRRVHPQDKMVQEILLAAEPFLARPCKTETPEYRLWLFDLWANAIRIRLGREEKDKVDALISGHFDFRGLLFFRESSYYSYRRNDFKAILHKTLRWLVYTGQFEHATSLLDTIQNKFERDFYQWRSLLATNLDEAISVATVPHTFRRDYGNDELVWQEMLNLLPSGALHSIANNERVKQQNRALIARTLFTRAVLLDCDNDLLDRYAALAGKLNPSIREQLLESVAGHNKDKYITFLLKMPRFRPSVYLEYAENPEYRRHEKGPAIDAIDVNNHNDNNWWCTFDDEMFERRILRAMKIIPAGNELFGGKKIYGTMGDDEGIERVLGDELRPYLDNQRRLLAQHPYTKLIDRKEIEALKNIPSGPRYLCEAVINRELKSKPATSSVEQNERAANLHRCVRTTRYSCNRCVRTTRYGSNCDGLHGECSRKAFTLLHKHYENTPWAKATPYWFN